MSDLNDIEKVRLSGVFDPDYYRRQYREELATNADPLKHFLERGLAQGFKPSALFDPVVYRIKHPQCGNPVIDYIERYRGASLDLTVNSALNIEKPRSYLPYIASDIDVSTDNTANLANANAFGCAARVEFSASGKHFSMTAPRASEFLDRIKSDAPFAFARLSHGDWDCLYVLGQLRKQIETRVANYGFSKPEIDALSRRLCDEYYPDRGLFAENVIPEILRDLDQHLPDPNFLYSVCFKGFPTADDRLFYLTKHLHRVDHDRLELFANYFDQRETLYDATVWKRWLISGDMRDFAKYAREHPVVLVGADRLRTLGARWDLPWFRHVSIPAAKAYPIRHAILESCLQSIADARAIAHANNAKRPIFLCQGSSFAYWLMVRLYKTYPDVFYIDMGQALHAWFWDDKTIPLLQWGKLYGKTIIRNSGLDEYYRKIGARLPPELADGLMSGRSEEGERQ